MVAFGIGMIVAHFFLYCLVFRNLSCATAERAVFLFHAIPASFIGMAVLGAVLLSSSSLAEALVVIGLQGIYSLSFLELWSLAQGGYSLSILMRFQTAQERGEYPDLSGLDAIGSEKKANRLVSLRRLSMLHQDGEEVELTMRGRVFATILSGLATLARVRRRG